MKVAIVTQPGDEVIPGIGGYSSISIIAYHLARCLVRSGHEVIFYGKKSQARPTVERDPEGILYRRISIKPEDLSLKPLRVLDRLGAFRNPQRPFFASRLYYPWYALQIAHDLKEKQPDIVHIMNFSQYVPLIRTFYPKAKFVLHMECEWLSQLDAALIASRLHQTDLVVGCSDYITNKIRRRFPEHAHRCQTVFNGVDLAQFTGDNGDQASQQDTGKRLLFSGRISPEKGVHVLLDAFRQVSKSYPDAQLAIAGTVGIAPMKFIVNLSDEAAVRALATFYHGDDYFTQLKARLSPDIANRVAFLGFVPHPDLVDHYRRADVLINPSLSEAFGMSLVEAMAVGTPVVAARVGGMVDIVEDGETGILTEPGSAEALAEGIIAILSKPALGKAMGQAGQKRVRQLFTWEQVTRNLDQYYQSL